MSKKISTNMIFIRNEVINMDKYNKEQRVDMDKNSILVFYTVLREKVLEFFEQHNYSDKDHTIYDFEYLPVVLTFDKLKKIFKSKISFMDMIIWYIFQNW